ncbi:MAG: AAA family ATPase [Verrucomicrobia bacterium]|nr:AAA family ATPase [Verrucomicrobiota bacterium]
MLEGIRNDRDDDWEDTNCSKQVETLGGKLPPCIKERGAFMSPRTIPVEMAHKLAYPNSYFGHMLPVEMVLPAYSANAVPFRWTNRRELEPMAALMDFGYDLGREPAKETTGFESAWVLNPENQSDCLETFFSAFRPEKTLCFFYAKHVPFVEAQGRVIVGVGFLSKPVPPLKEFNYEDPNNPPIRGYLWDRPISHSIRPDFKNGFLLPYHQLLAAAENNPSIDLEEYAAFAPADRTTEFSYVSEHVSADGAIGALRSCHQALQKMEKVIKAEYPWASVKAWINERLTELEKERGPFPGLGSALTALGMPDGVFLAEHLKANCMENQNPWVLFGRAVDAPETLVPEFRSSITSAIKRKWKRFEEKKPERRDLLVLISRMEISATQARSLFQRNQDSETEHTDKELTANPYLFYELTRYDEEPVSFATVDRGIFPGKAIEGKFPLPESARMDGPDDVRRLRALVVSVLHVAMDQGHSCLLRWQVLQAIRELELEPPLSLDKDSMEIFEEAYDGEQVVIDATDTDNPVYQLEERDEICRKIRTCRTRVDKFDRFKSSQDWTSALRHKDNFGAPKTEREKLALAEKAHALKELFESPFSVLIGSAGTGKTSLVRTLCQDPAVLAGGVLLLAPTGKARVRLEHGARHPASTLAQFLNRPDVGGYEGSTGRYLIVDQPISPAKTIIVDESSMLTEDQLASLLSAVTGYERLILVGDSRQLPPIGVGRPFVDIINLLRPEHFDPPQFKVGRGYAELTVRMRQNEVADGDDVNDLQLAV